MNSEDYCSYELSKALKAAGFDEPCDHYYNIGFKNDTDMHYAIDKDYNDVSEHCCSAPLLSLAQKWLREKKKMHCQVLLNGVRSMYFWQVREMIGNGMYADSAHQYDVYEDAMSDCISVALELIKKGE